jgi:hypothetical protein
VVIIVGLPFGRAGNINLLHVAHIEGEGAGATRLLA